METKTKTAVQSLFDELENDLENGVEISNMVFQKMFKKALEKEKKQTLDVYNKGYRDGLGLSIETGDVVGQCVEFCECEGVQDLITGTGECRKCGGQCTY